MTTWDLSDRETVGRLRRQAVSDAMDALEAMWPNQMPEDGDLARFADQKTVEFMQRSQGIPRWVFTAPENSPVRHYYEQVGNAYYWAFLDKLAEAVANLVVTSKRLPPRTTPLLAPSPYTSTNRSGAPDRGRHHTHGNGNHTMTRGDQYRDQA